MANQVILPQLWTHRGEIIISIIIYELGVKKRVNMFTNCFGNTFMKTYCITYYECLYKALYGHFTHIHSYVSLYMYAYICIYFINGSYNMVYQPGLQYPGIKHYE